MTDEHLKVEPRDQQQFDHRYQLRETFEKKLPLRYRDVEEAPFQQQTYGATSSAAMARMCASPYTTTTNLQRMKPAQRFEQEANGPSPPHLQPEGEVIIQEQIAEENTDGLELQPPMGILTNSVVVGGSRQDQDVVGTSGYVNTMPEIKPRPIFRNPLQLYPGDPRFAVGADLSYELKMNLRKLKNVLKLPKARRFVFCEFFYSGVDQQIFLAENEFSQLMQESFPNLKCTRMRKSEWREIRRLIGKPRRCSQVFLDEEREALEAKRQKIRAIYSGTCTSLEDEFIDLPAYLPRPPIVGQKIYARVRSPKDGIYAATVDAVTEDGYRVVFDKDNQLPASYIKDYEVMFDQPTELLSINYFLEQNRACLRGVKTNSSLYASNSGGYVPFLCATGKILSPVVGPCEPIKQSPKKVTISTSENSKVGNFPVRMLLIMVKICKVIEYKKKLIANLKMMNDCAEKMNMMGNIYPTEFKIQFSQLVIDLETVNKLFLSYFQALQTHYNTLLPHLNEPQPTDRPEVLRKTCNTHAYQIVKHCNNELNVRNKRILHLITSLASIMLQLRTIGAQKKRFTASDMSILGESLKQIRSQISPQNSAAFQDNVEVHLRQILRTKHVQPKCGAK